MKDLQETLDKAVEKLLARVTADANVPLLEAVKAFEAAMKWAEMKVRLAPPAPEPVEPKVNGFERIRGKFHGRKAVGRAPAPAPEPAEAEAAPDPFAGVAGSTIPADAPTTLGTLDS